MPMIVLLKNRNTNESINKMQYTIMIIIYSLALIIFELILSPIMQVKIVLNTLHIMINSSNFNRYDKYCKSIGIILASPFIIFMSIAVDLITLPKVVWKNEVEFEEKYQKNLDEPSDAKLFGVCGVVLRSIYKNEKIFGGKFSSYFELVCLHRVVFGIMENLNDLICKGTKDYKDSLLKV